MPDDIRRLMTPFHPRLDDPCDDPCDDPDDDHEGEPGEKGGGFNLVKLMLDSRTVLVGTAITDKLAEKVIGQVLLMEKRAPEAPILVIVNSPGGSADSGFAMLDVLRFVSCPITTFAMGLVASAGVMVFLGGDRERRFATPNSRFLLHQPSTMAMGPSSDMDITAGELIKIRERYNRIVAEECGIDYERVCKDVDRDFWLDAAQSLDYGLIRKVVGSRAEIE